MIVYRVPLTATDIDEIEGIADLGMPIGGTLVGRLCADWRRLTAERNAARAALPDPMMLHRAITALERIESDSEMDALWDDLRNAAYTVSAALAPAPVPAADVANGGAG